MNGRRWEALLQEYTVLYKRLVIVAREHPISTLVVITVLSWVMVILPYTKDLSIVYRYWDGPMYITVAKTFYDIPMNNPITDHYHWPPKVFAPFLLMYPLAIRIVAPILGYHWGMVALSVAFSTSAAVIFYVMLRDLKMSDHPLWLSILFLFVPHRWLIYRSVGASEPMFLTFLLLSLLLFAKRKYLFCFVAAAIACDTRIQGVFLVPTYVLGIFADRDLSLQRKVLLSLAALLIPSLLYVNLGLHYRAFGDILAYLDVNQSMVHIVPFWQMIDYARHPLNLEEYFGAQLYLLLYVITLIGIARLWRMGRSKAILFYCLITFGFLTLIVDEDLSRFMIPIAPFTWILGFENIWTDRRMRWIFPAILLLTYLYVWNLLPHNVAWHHTTNELLEWNP